MHTWISKIQFNLDISVIMARKKNYTYLLLLDQSATNCID